MAKYTRNENHTFERTMSSKRINDYLMQVISEAASPSEGVQMLQSRLNDNSSRGGKETLRGGGRGRS